MGFVWKPWPMILDQARLIVSFPHALTEVPQNFGLFTLHEFSNVSNNFIIVMITAEQITRAV